MADNRISLVCKVCGASIVIAKSFLYGFTAYDDIYKSRGCNSLTEALNKFFNEHEFCCSGGCYRLEYESDLSPDCSTCDKSNSNEV